MSLDTEARRFAFMNAAGGHNSPDISPDEDFSSYDRYLALGWVERIAADPGQIGWYTTGTTTINLDQVKGY